MAQSRKVGPHRTPDQHIVAGTRRHERLAQIPALAVRRVARPRLLEVCREAKEGLTPQARRIALDFGRLDPDLPEVVVPAPAFAERCGPMIRRTLEATEAAIRAAAVPGEAPVVTRPDRPAAPPRHFTEVMVREIIPMIDAAYRTLPDRAHRAMAGLSMGGGRPCRSP